MINQKEITAVELSPTKKDFYQIWNEIIDTAGKISERWDPSSTNESDPGIVLLKVLTAVADKINYTIDANTLEAFMPSAAQEESMRKLCEMLGYDMKYYRSATTDVRITYNNSGKDAINGVIAIDAFTNIKDVDGLVNYVTLNTVYLNANNTSKTVACMEGELVECETDDNNIVSLIHLDDNNRYYLPEVQIAENGIFITNVADAHESDRWEKVDNLNTRNIGEKIFKVGFDSKENLPYIQFPEDISTIIEDGLKIRYLRTNGANGNVSVNTLCKMEAPASWSAETDGSTAASESPDYYNVDNYTVTNIAASTNGGNLETINDAYNGFKKTIGTFDTLVTCRDYMNRIYQMTVDDSSSTNLVSNVVVSDIRDDINKAITLCTFTERGIEYKTMAKPIYLDDAIDKTPAQFSELCKSLKMANLGELYRIYDPTKDLHPTLYYARCIYNGNALECVTLDTTALTHFDLVIYPFKNIYGLNTKLEYVKSFKYDDSNLLEIQDNLEENKTLAHNFIKPNKDEIACIKNYYRLRAKITTVHKVGTIEQAEILGKVYTKLYENFNMRKVDFGEEIPYDSILTVLETADTRIKNVSLEDPELVTVFCTVGGGEFMTSTNLDAADRTALNTAGDKYYNQLVLNNVLAGRVALFNYDENFKPEYTEVQYPSWYDETTKQQTSYSTIYPDTSAGASGAAKKSIYRLGSAFEIDHGAQNVKLMENEVVQFRLQNLKTTKTYPAYVNYFIQLTDRATDIPAIPATMQTLLRLMEGGYSDEYDADHPERTDTKKASWESLINETDIKPVVTELTGADKPTADTWDNRKKELHAIFTKEDGRYIYQPSWNSSWTSATQLYYAQLSKDTVNTWNSWVAGKKNNKIDMLDPTEAKRGAATNLQRIGLYIEINTDITHDCGYLVDASHVKYKELQRIVNITADPFLYYHVQRLWSEQRYDKNSISSAAACHTVNGLGQNSVYEGIPANTEYRLKADEYLLINYTSSTTTDGNEEKTKINSYWGPGTIIKPNFDLIDSIKYHASHSYTKNQKDGSYSFADYGKTPEGMFTLGTNEQIEIREFVKVTLDEMSTNIYWELNEEIPDIHNRIYFPFDEDPVDSITGNPVTREYANEHRDEVTWTAYTLKDGEYFYYTDHNKSDIAYYGAGTKIKVTIKTPRIYKYSADNSISADDISTYGVTSAIPWRAFDFSKTAASDKSVELIEYQYLNLIEGNILNTVTAATTTSTGAANATTIEIDIDGDYKPVKSATYTLDDGKVASLPNVDFNDNSAWEVRSRLEFNVGQTKAQTLHSTNYTSDQILIYHTPTGTVDKQVITLTPHDNTPLVIKTNKTLQSSSTILDVTTKKFAEDGHLEEQIPDLQIKVLTASEVKNDSGASVNLNNFGEDGFTKLNFSGVVNEGTAANCTLNAVIPDGCFGLIMFYNVKTTPNKYSAGIRLIKANTSASTPAAPTIYNHTNTSGNKSWWYEDAGTINPGGYGKMASKAVWAVEGTEFKTLTEDEFKALFNKEGTGGLYRRQASQVIPNKSALHRYEEGTKKYFEYVAIELDTPWIANGIYGHLTSIGSSSAWAVEKDDDDDSFGRLTKDEFEIKRADTEHQLYIRNAISVGSTLTPTADQRFDYNDKNNTLYIYTRVTNVSSYNEDYEYGLILDHGGNTMIYHLRDGLNIVYLTNSCKVEIYPDELDGDTIVFGSLDIVRLTDTAHEISSINEKLQYKRINTATGWTVEDQILADIKRVDPLYNFYYNAIITNTLGIDMNIKDDDDHLENPMNWFDQNNINNKFVISEIDAGTLSTGVVIAKSSRSS